MQSTSNGSPAEPAPMSYYRETSLRNISRARAEAELRARHRQETEQDRLDVARFGSAI